MNIIAKKIKLNKRQISTKKYPDAELVEVAAVIRSSHFQSLCLKVNTDNLEKTTTPVSRFSKVLHRQTDTEVWTLERVGPPRRRRGS